MILLLQFFLQEKYSFRLMRSDILQVTEKAVLDGTSPPVQTIIFENTNYKSTPELAMKAKFSNHIKNQRIDKTRGEQFLVFGQNNFIMNF